MKTIWWAATFGRGFYVLDDYSPLRQLADEGLDGEFKMFPIKKALLYVPEDKLGGSRGSQGRQLLCRIQSTVWCNIYLFHEGLAQNQKNRFDRKKNDETPTMTTSIQDGMPSRKKDVKTRR